MRVLKDLLGWLFPPRDARDAWADRAATGRAASPAQMRALLDAVDGDYRKAGRLLTMWDSIMSTGLVSSERALQSVLEAAHRG